jgi:hypothetical protein
MLIPSSAHLGSAVDLLQFEKPRRNATSASGIDQMSDDATFTSTITKVFKVIATK